MNWTYQSLIDKAENDEFSWMDEEQEPAGAARCRDCLRSWRQSSGNRNNKFSLFFLLCSCSINPFRSFLWLMMENFG